jgi:hypothetical protein
VKKTTDSASLSAINRLVALNSEPEGGQFDCARCNHSNCLRRLAIRAAKFGPKPTPTLVKKNETTESQSQKKRGAFKGPIRIPLHSLLFLFNALAFPSIPSNSLKFRLVVFSIPTAPTKPLHLQRLIEAFDTNKAFDTI